MTLAITFKVLATGSQNVSGMIYDFSGSSYHYNDDGGSEPNLLTLTSTYGPTAPDAVDDSATTDEDTFVDVDVLANDSDVNGNLERGVAVGGHPAGQRDGQRRRRPDPLHPGPGLLRHRLASPTRSVTRPRRHRSARRRRWTSR